MKQENRTPRASSKGRTLGLALLAALAAYHAEAGLKYWDTGDYDADSYVQDGLVLNYDGIRNVGLDADHSTNATTWVNLGNGGATYDLTLTNWKEGLGAWEYDGYRFATEVGNGAHFNSPSISWNLSGQNRTIQIAMDLNRTDRQCETSTRNLGYIFYGMSGTKVNNNDPWRWFTVGVRSDNGTSSGVYSLACSLAYTYAVGDHFDYVTSILGDDYVSTFTGTTPPTSGTANTGYSKDASKRGDMATITKFSLGGSNSQGLTGKIKNVRYYNRVLEEEEIVWNRAVDDARFFGKPVSSIPATNAVIASSVAHVPGNETAGAYAVDASGYTFSAPASQTVDGRIYTCTGYTLETWDDATGDWGAPEDHSGSLSCAATDTSRIRITWQWTAGDGIVTRYTTADYVQDGLVLNYDGIRNVGADRPHSIDTTVWKNLAPNGGWDMTFYAITGATKPGEWRADGYRFEQESYFTPGAAFTLPSNQTIQVALHANALDQFACNASGAYVNEAYIYYNKGTFNKGGSLSIRKDVNATGNDWIDWSTHGYGTSDDRPSPKTGSHGAPINYVTAVLADDYAAAFFGTNIPTAQTARWTDNASRRTLTSVPQVQIAGGAGFGIGGIADPAHRMRMKGTVKSFRFYNRVLTDEELAQNRVVDDYRFHGVMPVTNVVVATSHAFLAGNEPNGNYEISGAYAFSAPVTAQRDSRNFTYTFAGYTIETWDAAARGWSAPVSYESSSYSWNASTSPDKVRLTWVWKATGNLRTAADFGLEDVVPNGLVLHYDGIKNIGAESDDVTNPTNAWSKAWVNLADPCAYTLARKDKTTRAGCWTDCGYAFTNTSGSVGGYFQHAGDFTFTPRYSLQVLVDAASSDQTDTTCGYLMFNAPWKSASIGIRTATDYGANGAFYYVADEAFGGTSSRPRFTSGSRTGPYSYATAIINGMNAMFFEETEYPTTEKRLFPMSTDASAQTVSMLRIGGGSGGQDFTGTLKSFRYYDRVLTAEELVRNRNVDSARYFGALATTNVFVETSGGTQAETGAYKVEGSWTFTATTVMKKNGAVVPVTRYAVETLANGAWTDKTWHDGTSYTYTEGTDPAAVRLTWSGAQDGTMLIVR